MSSYTDIPSFRREFWQVNSDEIHETILDTAATMAYNTINAALNSIYSVPFSVTYPPMIVDISNILTKYYALLIAKKGSSPAVAGENEGDLKKLAEEMLDDLRTGKKDLPDEARLSSLEAWSNTMDRMRIFDLDDPINHGVDLDYLDELESLRR